MILGIITVTVISIVASLLLHGSTFFWITPAIISLNFLIVLLMHFKHQEDEIKDVEKEEFEEDDSLYEEDDSDIAKEFDLNRLQKSVQDYKNQLNSEKQNFNNAYKNALVPIGAYKMVEQLGDLVISTTNQSVLEITEDIYSIVDNSKKLNALFHEVSKELSEGEHSLQNDMEQFVAFIKELNLLESEFQAMVANYKEDMGKIEDSAEEIGNYTTVIEDLSEKINILAINASIEAARVGKEGQGFSVIAGEVQKLSGQTKEFAENINDMMKKISHLIGSTYHGQRKRLDSAAHELHHFSTVVLDMAEAVKPQLNQMDKIVHESEKRGEELTIRLNDITKSLQFQDMIRQVLEHVEGIVVDLNGSIKDTFRSFSAGAGADTQSVRALKEELALKYFTVKDEWDAIHMEQPEQVEVSTVSTDEDMDGDITLF